MQQLSLRHAVTLFALALLLVTVAVPATAAPRRAASAGIAESAWTPVDLLSLLWDALRSPGPLWPAVGIRATGAIDPNGRKEGMSVDPNGAPHSVTTPEGSTVDEGGMIDPDGRQ